MKTLNTIAAFLTLLLAQLGSLSAQDKYAVIIGVESYDPQYLTRLDYAEEDALALGESLKALGFETQILTGQANSTVFKPSTPEKILRVLKTQMNSCIDGDTLVISLSGHGLQFGDEEVNEDGVRETYFCPEDANPEDKSTLLPISDIIQLMKQCEARRKLLLIDACRNDFVSSAGQRKAGKRLQLSSVHETRRTIPGGMTVLFSCDQNQFSWEDDDLGHSVFSYFVINYLNGEAEDRFYDDHQVNLDNLTRYVRKRTNEYVSNNNLSADGQSPVLSGSGSDWVLGIAMDPIRLLLQKHVDWLGGADQLRRMRSYKASGVLSSKDEDGNAYEMDISYIGKGHSTTHAYAYQGTPTSRVVTTPSAGWNDDFSNVEYMSASDNWGNQMMMRYPFSAIDMLENAHQFTIGKVQTFGGTTTTELIQTDGETNTIKWYFNEEGKLLKLAHVAEDVESEFRLDQYTEYSGIKFPMREMAYTDGIFNYKIQMNDLEFNKPVDASLFRVSNQNVDQSTDAHSTRSSQQSGSGFTRQELRKFVRTLNETVGDISATSEGMFNNLRYRIDGTRGIAAEITFANGMVEQIDSSQLTDAKVKQMVIPSFDDETKQLIRAGHYYRVILKSSGGTIIFETRIIASDL